MNAFYKNKVVVVTGASSGIGAEIIRHLMSFEAKITLIARSKDKMEALVAAANYPKEKYLIIQADFAEKQDFKALAMQVKSYFGKIDILINNAGIAQKSLVQETTEAVERRVMEVNYFSAINITKAFLPHFIEQKQGQIAAVSSILGEIGLPLVAPYCATKHAINGYFNSLRYDIEKHNVSVHIVSPGFIKTEITKKSLTGAGEIHNQDSVAQEKGMDAGKCAYGILKNIKKQKRTAYVGGLEVFMPKFALVFPKLFHYLMRKMHKI